MANFDDITGWKGEFQEFLRSGIYEQWNKKDEDGGSIRRPIPISNVYEFIELVMKNDELWQCVIRINAWYHEDGKRWCMADDDPDNPTFPHKANNNLNKFADWYAIKSDVGPDSVVFMEAKVICGGIESGVMDSIEDPKVSAHLKKLNNVIKC